MNFDVLFYSAQKDALNTIAAYMISCDIPLLFYVISLSIPKQISYKACIILDSAKKSCVCRQQWRKTSNSIDCVCVCVRTEWSTRSDFPLNFISKEYKSMCACEWERKSERLHKFCILNQTKQREKKIYIKTHIQTVIVR